MAVKTPLKWVGSKARLMPQLLPHLPEGKRLIEPFAGSCAVMMNTDYDEYLIADVNPDLVNLYKTMAYQSDALLIELEALFSAGSLGDEESRAVFYYAVRDAFNQSGKSFGSESVEAAARFLYLNRHCFNGLCRYNRRGQFNVPFGKYKKTYFPADEIRAFAEKAKRATFITAHYSETLDLVRDGHDVVYCDPPYLTDTDNFTAYHERGFSHMDQGRLARKLRRLTERGIKVVASNSDLEMVHYLYAGFEAVRVTGCQSGGRCMSKRISGMSFDTYLDGDLIHIEKITLDITDNSAAAQTRGVPDGHVDGDVAAEGEIEVSSKVLGVLTAKARAAGSWRGIPPLDFLFYAKAGSEEMKVESFGNKLQLSNLLDIDPKGGGVATHKIKYFVTSPKFVNINGVPYLEAEATENLIG
jgi:DNA adenine methylase